MDQTQIPVSISILIGLGSGAIGSVLGSVTTYLLQRQKLMDEARTKAREQLRARGEELYMLVDETPSFFDGSAARLRSAQNAEEELQHLLHEMDTRRGHSGSA